MGSPLMFFELSTKDAYRQFIGAKALSVSIKEDFDDGPIAIKDMSQGLRYQVWQTRVEDDICFLSAENISEYPYITKKDLVSVNLTFDGNARPVVAYTAGDKAYTNWFNSQLQEYVTTDWGSGISSIKVFNDEKRPFFQADADVLLVYIKNNKLYYRTLRERFTIEHLIAGNIVSEQIIRFGMLSNYRLGIRLKQHEPPERF